VPALLFSVGVLWKRKFTDADRQASAQSKKVYKTKSSKNQYYFLFRDAQHVPCLPL
jgi:hypothetical protein